MYLYPKQITAYHNRVSGPIQERMDMLLNLDTVALDRETAKHNETSASIRSRVAAARKQQYAR